ncbi:MAG: hypothetical protein J2P15_07875 [Micromonosporaceae bacterium]|nr:hypothetical protein [Micromonosporaceae bacterium]
MTYVVSRVAKTAKVPIDVCPMWTSEEEVLAMRFRTQRFAVGVLATTLATAGMLGSGVLASASTPGAAGRVLAAVVRAGDVPVERLTVCQDAERLDLSSSITDALYRGGLG